MTQEVTALRADGVAARMLDRIQVQELVRTSLGPEIIGGRFMPEESVIHAIQLVHGLAHAAYHKWFPRGGSDGIGSSLPAALLLFRLNRNTLMKP